MSLQAVVLLSTVPSSVSVEGDQRSLLDLLAGKHIAVEIIDGAQDANKTVRNALWDISHKRAVYPQLFVRPADGSTVTDHSQSTPNGWKFLGDWTMITELNEDNTTTKALDNLLNDVVRKQ